MPDCGGEVKTHGIPVPASSVLIHRRSGSKTRPRTGFRTSGGGALVRGLGEGGNEVYTSPRARRGSRHPSHQGGRCERAVGVAFFGLTSQSWALHCGGRTVQHRKPSDPPRNGCSLGRLGDRFAAIQADVRALQGPPIEQPTNCHTLGGVNAFAWDTGRRRFSFWVCGRLAGWRVGAGWGWLGVSRLRGDAGVRTDSGPRRGERAG